MPLQWVAVYHQLLWLKEMVAACHLLILMEQLLTQVLYWMDGMWMITRSTQELSAICINMLVNMLDGVISTCQEVCQYSKIHGLKCVRLLSLMTFPEVLYVKRKYSRV